MRLFAIGIEHAGVIAVDRPQRGDARQKHPGDLPLGRMRQGLGRSQDFRHGLLGLGHRAGEVRNGLPQCRQLAAVGQRDRIVKTPLPAFRLTRRDWRPPGRISSSWSDRLAQPLHRELIIPRLQMAPAFDLGLVAVLGIFREIISSDTARFAMLSGELLTDVGIARHGP